MELLAVGGASLVRNPRHRVSIDAAAHCNCKSFGEITTVRRRWNPFGVDKRGGCGVAAKQTLVEARGFNAQAVSNSASEAIPSSTAKRHRIRATRKEYQRNVSRLATENGNVVYRETSQPGGMVITPRQTGRKSKAQFVVRGSSTSVSGASEAGQVEHSQILESFFDKTGEFFEAKNDPPDWIKKVVAAGLVEKGSSALVGPGSVSLVPLLRSLGVNTVVAHWSLLELASIKASDDEIRCWHGNVEKLPHSWGKYDAVFLGHSPAMAFSASTLFDSVIRRCRTGARVVINQIYGNDFLAPYREIYPHILLRYLPELEELQSMINGLPMEFVSFQSDSSAYLVALEVNESVSKAEKEIDYADIGDFPLYALAKVVYGFGRGSKQMGIPTANLNPEELSKEIQDLPKGVYFGWVQVRGEGLDAGVHKMVMNIGNRPTFADSDAISVEVHILHKYEIDFYGKDAAVVVLGFIRPEMKFSSLDALVARIGEDIKIARSCLEEEVLKSYQTDRFFRM